MTWGKLMLRTASEGITFDGEASPAPSVLQSPPVHVSSAQILALNTVPVTVVPAQAGSVLIPLWLVSTYTPGGTGYTISGSGITLDTDSIGAILLLPALNSALASTDESVSVGGGFSGGPDFFAAPSSAAPGLIRLTADDIIEDGDGTLELVCVYLSVPLP